MLGAPNGSHEKFSLDYDPAGGNFDQYSLTLIGYSPQMFTPLNSLPSHVVVDANILLDAAFIRDGVAWRSLFVLGQLGFTPIIDANIESEARQILKDYNQRYCPNLNLLPVLIETIAAVPVLSLQRAPQIKSRTVNNNDIHVLSAAAEYDAWVLTGDLDLHLELVPHCIQTRVPYDVIMSASPELTMEKLIRIVAPKRESGMIFGRVSAPYWPESTSTGQFTVCEVGNVGRLYYDNGSKEWVFAMTVCEPVRVKCDMANNELWSVCGSYRLPGNGNVGEIRVMVGRHPDTTCIRSAKTEQVITANTSGECTYGNSIAGNSCWNGSLQAIVVGPQGVSKDSWKKIVAVQYGAPNPYDSGMVQRVFQSVGSANMLSMGRILLPSEQQLESLNL